MASRSKLFTHSRAQNTKNTIQKINLVIFDIDVSHIMISDPTIELKIFNKEEIDFWFDYITSNIENIYLFISNMISNTLIQLIHYFPQITSIYIFCKDQQYKNDSNTQRKLRGIYNDIDMMFKQFQDDRNTLKNQYYSEESTFKNIDSQSAEVLWCIVFDKILEHIRRTNIAKNELTAFCRECFQDSEYQLKRIEEFHATYTSDKVIDWYTRDTFFYVLLNKTLRTEKNLNNIFKLRLIIPDLISELRRIQSDYHEMTHYPPIVYRGQQMTKQELQQIKSHVGKSFFVNQFLSTSMEYGVAEVFAMASSGDPDTQSVLLKIDIDSFSTKNGTTPFANITKYSYFKQEEEVLFSIHSTFLIESVELSTDNLWNIKLKHMDNLWDVDFGERSIFSPHADQIFIRHLSKENKQFIAFQLLVDLILRLEQNNYAKQELIEICRSKYQHDPIELKKINDFGKNYRSEDAAKWYTKDSFLYRLLNESLRIETIDFIVKMRYFIHDLHNQLAELQPSFIQSLNGKKNLTLYRGQRMKMNQLDEMRENRDGFISMNSFLSATQDEDVAIAFSGNGTTKKPDEVSVIYEILIDTDIRSTPYAKIESINPDEQEVLFSMGSVFRIGNVEKIRNKVYRVQLTMVHKEDQLWNKLTAHLD
jgi:hypothetical protein